MVSLFFYKVVSAAVLFAVSQVCGVFAAPTGWDGMSNEARDILARATPVAPHWVVYGDKYAPGTTGPPDPSEITVSTIVHANVKSYIRYSIIARGCRDSTSCECLVFYH